MAYKFPIGGTPTYKFELPIEIETPKNAEIIFAQQDNNVLTKTLTACNCDKNILSLRLTQEETLLFNDSATIVMWMRVLTKDDEVILSDDVYLVPCKCRSKEVLR